MHNHNVKIKPTFLGACKPQKQTNELVHWNLTFKVCGDILSHQNFALHDCVWYIISNLGEKKKKSKNNKLFTELGK